MSMHKCEGENMKLTEKLYQLRKYKGLSQEKLAEELYVSRQAVSRWESGETIPTIDNMAAISRFYGVTVDCLIKEDCEIEYTAISDGEREEGEVQEVQGHSFDKKNFLGCVIFATAVIALAIIIGSVTHTRTAITIYIILLGKLALLIFVLVLAWIFVSNLIKKQ